jgi:hypothetical protein
MIYIIFQKIFLKIKIILSLRPGNYSHKDRRNGRAVECGGLENRCTVTTVPGVRIPLSPPKQSDQPRISGVFVLTSAPEEACFRKVLKLKQKNPKG